MNSFRFLERGIEAEIERQAAILDGGGGGRPGDAALRPRGRLADPAALEGVLARLPLLPGARPGAAGADRGDAGGGARGAARAARRAARALPDRARALRGARDHSSPSTPSSASTSSGAVAAGDGAAAKAIANWVTGELVARSAQAGATRTTRRLEGDARGGGRAGRAGRGEADLPRRRPQVLATLVADGGRPGRDRRARGARRRSRTPASSRRSSSGRSRPSPRPPSGCAQGNAKAIGPLVGAVMRETKGRADGGEVTRLIHEKLGVA